MTTSAIHHLPCPPSLILPTLIRRTRAFAVAWPMAGVARDGRRYAGDVRTIDRMMKKSNA